jgi:hypothetical protein
VPVWERSPYQSGKRIDERLSSFSIPICFRDSRRDAMIRALRANACHSVLRASNNSCVYLSTTGSGVVRPPHQQSARTSDVCRVFRHASLWGQRIWRTAIVAPTDTKVSAIPSSNSFASSLLV